MPRASSKSDISNRAPRRRVEKRVRKTSGSKTERVEREEGQDLSRVNAGRKAPMIFSEEKKTKKKIPKKVFLMSLAVVACLVLAIFVGKTDGGQIDTAAKIAENAKTVANSTVEFDEYGNEIKRDEIVPPPVVPASRLKPRGVGTAKIESPAPTLAETETSATSSEDENGDFVEAGEGEGEEEEKLNNDEETNSIENGDEGEVEVEEVFEEEEGGN